MTRTDHLFRRVVLALAGVAVGLIVSVIVVLNLHILAGLEQGYAATPREVWDHSALLALADITLLVAGAVFGFRVSWSQTGRSLRRVHAAEGHVSDQGRRAPRDE